MRVEVNGLGAKQTADGARAWSATDEFVRTCVVRTGISRHGSYMLGKRVRVSGLHASAYVLYRHVYRHMCQCVVCADPFVVPLQVTIPR